MNTKLMHNVLSEDEIIFLKQLKNDIKGKIDTKKGRELKPVSDNSLLKKEIIDKLTSIASEFYKKELKLYAVAFGKYSKEFGIPKLPPHIDEVPSQLTLDYQLDGNIEWPIIIEGEICKLKNNSILMFEGENVLHWRPKQTFLNDEFLELMWFQFVDNEHWSHNSEIRPDYKNFKELLKNKLNKWRDQYNGI